MIYNLEYICKVHNLYTFPETTQLWYTSVHSTSFHYYVSTMLNYKNPIEHVPQAQMKKLYIQNPNSGWYCLWKKKTL